MTTSDLWQTDPARAIELAVEEVHRSDAFTENGKAEIAVRLLDVLRNWQPALKIRCPDGADPLTKEELKALGLRGNIKMDREFWEALSEGGRADPIKAVDAVYFRASGAITNEANLLVIRSLGVKKCLFYGVGDDRDCAFAKRIHRKTIPADLITSWPPAECDAEWCRCVIRPKMI